MVQAVEVRELLVLFMWVSKYVHQGMSMVVVPLADTKSVSMVTIISFAYKSVCMATITSFGCCLV